MAEVFKAKSFGVEGFEKVVVIKRILPELAARPLFVDMFIHEAKLAVRLSHANIVQVFDLGIAAADASSPGGAYFMAMEYVHGFDLATILARSRRQQMLLPLEMCVYVAAEVAKGLDHAHRRRDELNMALGIVHRDVSPQNVLLSMEGEVKVTDFGIAKARGALEPTGVEDTRTRRLQGKFAYMSPEQAAGETVDARSDLFSLGITLYECITGVNPFTGPTTFETLRRVQACEFPPIELLRPDIPSNLAFLVEQAMAKNPEARFSDAGRMYEALLAFLYSQGKRFGPHDLAELLTRFRDQEQDAAGPAEPALDADSPAMTTTPVEVPSNASFPARPRLDSEVFQVETAAELGERREVTALVLFLGGDESSREQATDIVERYGGTVLPGASDQGTDQVAALFGLVDPDARDTEIATRCALVLLRSLAAGLARPSVGLHTARIHVTLDGSPTADERLEFLVAAARELARSGPGLATISSSAHKHVRDLFVFETLDAEDSLPPRRVVRDVRGISEAFGRFVGRREELRRIGEILALSTRRRPRVLTIRGDNGVGKTRLLVEMERRVKKGGYNFATYLATCPPRGGEFPLSGIRCMLHVLCGLSEGATHDQIVPVAPRLRALGLTDEEVTSTLGVLGASTKKGQAGSAVFSLTSAFARMMGSLADDRPHVFLWDGAHAMDAKSFGLLQEAFSRNPSMRTVIVLAGRAGFSHPLEKLPDHTSIELVDLTAEDLEHLVMLRLGVRRVPAALLTFVRERAGGHPLFVEEVLKGIVDARAITVADGSVVSMRLVGQELALPKTLRGLVASRVARIASEDRGILQAAAILGDAVEVPVLAQMTGLPIPALDRSLSHLKAERFLIDTGPEALRFASPIVREVVVDALTPKATTGMHAAAGAALQALFGGKGSEHATRIATHLYEAGERDRAATFFAASAQHRLAARQLEAAARDYSRAIELCDAPRRDAAELVSWLTDLAEAVRLVRTAPEAFEMSERVILRADQSGILPLRVRARIAAGRLLAAVHAFDAARAQLSQAEIVSQGDDPLTKAVLSSSAELAARQGDFKRALALLERLENIATSEGDRQEEHKTLLFLAGSHAALGSRGLSVRYLARAESVLPASDIAAACEREKARAIVDYFASDFRGAAAACERGADLARELGISYEVAVNLHNLGDALVRLDDYARAYGAFKQSMALCDEAAFDRLSNHNRMFLAYLDALRGDEEARAQLLQGIAHAESHDFMWDVLSGRWLLAKLHVFNEDRDAARAEYDKLRLLSRNVGNRLIEGDCDEALARLNHP